MTGIEATVAAEMAMLAAMSPVRAYGVGDLARRWGTSKTVALKWMKGDGFVKVTVVNATESSPGVMVVDQDETHAWEDERRAAGLPLPGDRRRGPDRKPRKLRPSRHGTDAPSE